MVITIAALQIPLGSPITLEDQLHLFRRRPDFVCLPEYFSVRPGDHSHLDGAVRVERLHHELAKLSRDLGCVVIGGTLAELVDNGYENLSTIYDRGERVGAYQKVNPLGREEERGILPGREYRVFDVAGVRVGILICADVLNPDSFTAMHREGAEVIFAPTISPFLVNDTITEKDRRDIEIFMAGAQKAQAYVVKTCGIGTIFGHKLQGRSGVFAPWGILARVPPDDEQRKLIITHNLNIDEIREFKQQMDSMAPANHLAPAGKSL
jgi:predicted amidohydrolase